MIRILAMFAMIAVAAPAWPCTIIGGPLSAERLLNEADVVVRVRAEGLSSTPGRRDRVLSASPTQVTFAILQVLKGRLSSSTIEFNGSLNNRDDPNERPVPPDFVRPEGRGGNCYALTYRLGAEYLLLLQRQGSQLTPYWAPLSPTNEQLFSGTDDPWFVWVRNKLRRGIRFFGRV